MGRYAENTTVDPSRSREELERTLTRYGADAFSYGWEGNRAVVQFRVPLEDDGGVRLVKFELVMPDRDDDEFTLTSQGRARSEAAALKEWEGATRQRWRALLLVVKAKLEAVDSGITTFDTEFLAHLVLPDGSTVGDAALPAIERAYATGTMPKLLGA